MRILKEFFAKGTTDKTILQFDIETNGLLYSVSRFHCAVTENLATGERKRYTPDMYHELLKDLHRADVLVAHNGINYDVPALKKLYPFWTIDETKVVDTLVLSRVVFSNVADRDVIGVKRWRAVEEWRALEAEWSEYNKGNREVFDEDGNYLRTVYVRRPARPLGAFPDGWVLPPRLIGSHSLKAWGYRLGELKGEYGQQENAWDKYSEEMLDYCEQDVAVTTKLIKRLYAEEYDIRALQLEHEIAWLMAKQERNGFVFNVKQAEQFYFELLGEREDIRQKLMNTFGSWYAPNGVTNPKRSMTRLGVQYQAGCPYTKIKLVTFNPASRQHCAKVLQERGVVFTSFTETGQPKVDETSLKEVALPEAKMLRDFFVLDKLIGQLAEGKQAWLKAIHKDGCIHGSVNPCGAVTGRATHSNPNVAQVPSGKTDLGKRCRELFTVPEGWVLLGSDASGLELRCLGHAMTPWDNGAYSKVILEGDIHWTNAQAAGFIPTGTIRDEHNDEHEAARNAAKRFIYAFLYGAGDELIGQLVGYTEEEYEAWKAKGTHKGVIKQLERRGIQWSREMVCFILKGKEVKKRFLKGLPALKKLIDECKKRAGEDGFIKGLDGRLVHCRSQHSALNALLQSMGALVCKLWCVVVDQRMKQLGYKHGFDGDYAYCAWVHDEIQVACRTPEVAAQLGVISKEAMHYVEEYFAFDCPLDAEFKTGLTWRETH